MNNFTEQEDHMDVRLRLLKVRFLNSKFLKFLINWLVIMAIMGTILLALVGVLFLLSNFRPSFIFGGLIFFIFTLILAIDTTLYPEN